ncbi:hypothetical protein ACFOZ7_02730 [Natribaculum luteum]|uniref:Uncharacterized protein n=1 Tax=Natribaculum luteum TaxID=1586232 RepID=A0ABD5NVY1_9EURY|nr:hypothetical protein [Natribaculum luteum]
MTGDDRYKLFGVYVPQSIADSLAEFAYEEGGVVDLESYFDPDASTVPVGDPGADATDALVSAVVENFAALYDAADFEAARRVDPDAFVLVHLAAEPETVASARERFRAAATIQEADLRTVHTAILAAQLDDGDATRA